MSSELCWDKRKSPVNCPEHPAALQVVSEKLQMQLFLCRNRGPWFTWEEGLVVSMKAHSNCSLRSFLQDWIVNHLKGQYKIIIVIKKNKTRKCVSIFGSLVCTGTPVAPLILPSAE